MKLEKLLNEIIDLSKSFEKGARKREDAIKADPDKEFFIKGWQLEKYFELDDIKIKKHDHGADIYVIYRHIESGERIDVLWHSIKDSEKGIFKNFTNHELLKHLKGAKKLPHVGDDVNLKNQEWEFKLLGEDSNES